jgi:tetratricopeptide (TPR) repeat protein
MSKPFTRRSSPPGARCAAWPASVALLLLAAAGFHAQAQQAAVRGAEPPGHPCGLIYTGHYGPYDYRTQRSALAIVEEFHFDARVEAGIRGLNGHLAGDINYTLKASPNHHRALVTLVNVTTRAKANRLPGMEWPVECYFDRAIRFRPDDSVVRSLYAQWLFQRKRPADAVTQLDAAIGMSAENAFSQFNIGLVFLQNGMLDRALEQAHRAQAMGFPRTELIDSLKSRGAWQEPAPASAPAGSQPG